MLVADENVPLRPVPWERIEHAIDYSLIAMGGRMSVLLLGLENVYLV
jgi:hypothetical protein